MFKLFPGMTDGFLIVPTTLADLPAIYRIIEDAIHFTRQNNYPVFPYYAKEILEVDIALQQQYKLVMQNEIAGFFSVCYSDEIIWGEKGDAIYLHRVAIDSRFKGQRQFQHILDWAIAHAKEKGKLFVRLDTWAQNPKLIDYYKGHGFEEVGRIITPDTNDLPETHRKLALVLLEIKL